MHKKKNSEDWQSINNLISFYILTAFFCAIIILNVHVYLHSTIYPKLLATTIVILGVLYGIGFPLGIVLHANKFICFSWNSKKCSVKHYFIKRTNDVFLEWEDLSSVVITIDHEKRESIEEAIKDMRCNHVSRLHVPVKHVYSAVEIFINAKDGRSIIINSQMFDKPTLISILSVIQTHFKQP